MNVIRPSEHAATDRGGGVRTWHLVTADIGATAFVNGITEFDVGASLPLHWHNCEESVVVLAGKALFERNGETYELVPNDTTWIATGEVHRFANPDKCPLRILWTYGSISATRTIANTGETFDVAMFSEHLPKHSLHGISSTE